MGMCISNVTMSYTSWFNCENELNLRHTTVIVLWLYDCRSDSSLVPDGENFIVADVSSVSKGNEKYGSDDSAQSESNCVKPVEELSYG